MVVACEVAQAGGSLNVAVVGGSVAMNPRSNNREELCA